MNGVGLGELDAVLAVAREGSFRGGALALGLTFAVGSLLGASVA